MDLAQYISALQEQLAVAAASGGDEALSLSRRDLQPRLKRQLDSSCSKRYRRRRRWRSLGKELAPGFRRRPFVCVDGIPNSSSHRRRVGQVFEHEASGPSAFPRQEAASEGDEDSTARITLRLPEQLKLQMEAAANREGLSVNAWLVRAVVVALKNRGRPSGQGIPSGGEHFTGWVG